MNDSRKLVALLDEFHITDRALVRSRERAREAADPGSASVLKKEMRRYFAALEREAAAQLSSLDRKLDELYQRQYNLQAERGVAERRLQGARRILAALEHAAEEAG